MVATMLPTLLPIFANLNVSWHLVPLAAMISLVYSASRVELPAAIIQRSVRLFLTIFLFMGVVFAILWVLSLGL